MRYHGTLLGYSRSLGMVYFRVFGYGLHARDLRRFGYLTYSERHGRGLRIGPIRVKVLKP